MARTMPQARGFVILSLRTKCEISAQKIGLVDTMTTELATEVYFSEAIQVAKWRQRKAPEEMR